MCVFDDVRRKTFKKTRIFTFRHAELIKIMINMNIKSNKMSIDLLKAALGTHPPGFTKVKELLKIKRILALERYDSNASCLLEEK